MMYVIPVLLLVLWLSKLRRSNLLRNFSPGFDVPCHNCTNFSWIQCVSKVESWPILIISERSNETRSEHYGVNLLGISLSIKLVDPSYIKKDRYLSYLYIIYHLFCQKEQTFIVFCKKKVCLGYCNDISICL